MNHALLFAGGTGKRMQSNGMPKQFLMVYEKPIIIHTVEHFEQHPEIDNICIVCLESHIEKLQRYLDQYHIRKVGAILPGGTTSQESIRKGLTYLHTTFAADDIVLIHDGVRPLIDEDLISRNIARVKLSGNAITATKASETFCTVERDEIRDVLPREHCMLAKAPQSFRLGDIVAAHDWAQKNGITDAVDSADLSRRFGKKLHFVECPSTNIKITYPMDYYILKGIISAQENEQIMGL